jgi:hypothetical protein
MSVQDWSAVAVALIAVLSAVYGLLRWLVKNWLNELKPNGGTSVKDAVTRLDIEVKNQGTRIDDIHAMLRVLIERKK